ncbi:MAG TPA: SMI1/KNR4 family protein [Gemmataceae bacterium]|nr:SMI1/KNR4 family protein [Gemmataceae bacterium]
MRRPLPAHLVVVQRDAEDNEPFCLDTSKWSDEECPVVLYYLNSDRTERIAPDFLAFYERCLAPCFERITGTS